MNAAIPIPSTATNTKISLTQVKRGRIDSPFRILAYGPEGVGKSSLAAGAPAPLFLGSESGTEQLDVARIEPRSWEDVFSIVSELGGTKHEYRTLVLDTLDWLEPVCWEHICRLGGKKSLGDFTKGAGYIAAVDEWRRLLSWLDRLRTTKMMNIVLIAHSVISTFNNPEGDDFDRYTLKMNGKTAGLIKEWSDAVLFCNYETVTRELKGKGVRAIDTGARFINTVRHAAYDAKNRYNLPEQLPLDWCELEQAMRANAPNSPERIRAALAELIPSLWVAEDKTKYEAAITRAGDDSEKLAKLADVVRGKLALQGDEKKENEA